MGVVNATVTFVVGYFIIEFISNNKDGLVAWAGKIIPIHKLRNKLDNKVPVEAYLVLFGFVAKDFFL
jgi:hypothetical protein|tara:strand:+ start:238 stop:438 length:201 start_codon:yes stop_codon:yes gene_type:complete